MPWFSNCRQFIIFGLLFFAINIILPSYFSNVFGLTNEEAIKKINNHCREVHRSLSKSQIRDYGSREKRSALYNRIDKKQYIYRDDFDEGFGFLVGHREQFKKSNLNHNFLIRIRLLKVRVI